MLHEMKSILLLAVVLLPHMFAHRDYGHKGHDHGGHEDREPVVFTPRGRILGSRFTSRLGKTIYGFRGIGYAKPPINQLRFQPPQPADEWTGTYNATQDAPTCPQIGFQPNSEDCLYLNVYTTKLPTRRSNPKQPVIVHLHAGAFVAVTGRSNWAGPQYLLDEDVVLVTLNYRLGMLGFISTGTKEAPGNLGLKDQVQALKWVKENIIHFGGNPECVTIYGYSAGSSSVYLHMMSPMTKGLFHRAIAGSASPFGTWPRKTNQLDLVKRHARLVNCPVNSVTEMINCLKTVPAQTLAESTAGLREFGNDPILLYEPVIEPDFGQQRYLTDKPIELALRGEYQNVPLMTGITKIEFGYIAFDILANETLLKELNQDFDRVIPIIFDYERGTERSRIFSEGIRKFYFNNQPVDNSTFTGLDQLYNDGLTGFPVNRGARLVSAKNKKPTFYYQFSYKGRYSHYYLPGTNNVPWGPVHHDDLIYLFYISTLFPKFTESDPESRMVDKMIKMWANFAREGNPIPSPTSLLDDVSWTPFTTENGIYMDIGNKLKLKDHLHEKRYQEWEKLLPLPTVV